MPINYGENFKKGIINSLSNKDCISESELAKSRTFSIFEGCSARTVFTLTGGAFLSGLVKNMGANDSINGLISAIPTLSGFIMLITPLIFERISKRKIYIIWIAFISRLLLSFMFLVPLLVKDNSFNTNFIVIIYLLANLFISFITPSASNWVISLAPENIRGKYFGMRESYVLAFVAIATLIMGQVFDFYKKNHMENMGFLILFIVVFILTLVNFYFATKLKEPRIQISKIPLKPSELVSLPIRNKKFRIIILLMVLWNIGFQLSAPFAAVYMVSGLMLNYSFITITLVFASVASVLSARILGKFADMKSWLYIIGICVGLQAASQLIWFFVTKNTAIFLIPIAQLISGAAIGGINISLLNLQFKYSPNDRKTVYLGFSSAIGGLVGFSSSLLGAVFIGISQRHKFNIFGFQIGNMQMLFGVSSVLLIICTCYICFFKEKTF